MTHLAQTVCIAFLTILGLGNVMATEEAEYTVVLKDQNFEVPNSEQTALGPWHYPSSFRTRCASTEKSKSFPFGSSSNNNDTAIGTKVASRKDSSK